MNDQTPPDGPPPVIDARPAPPGLLSTKLKTLLGAAAAAAILIVALVAGSTSPTPRAVAPRAEPTTLDPQTLREYQRQLQQLATTSPVAAPRPPSGSPIVAPTVRDARRTTPDPTADERKRKEYESLFASNVVLSRRPEAERLSTPPAAMTRGPEATGSLPTLDELTQSVVKAMGPTATPARAPAQSSVGGASDPTQANAEGQAPKAMPAPGLHRVFEGTLIDGVLTNRLDGSGVAPVNALVTTPVYAQDGTLVLPEGARVLGTTKAVTSFGDTRLAVSFHRIVTPDGHSYTLDRFVGLNPLGDAGLKDQVNRHYLSTFGAAGAVGLITGLSEWVATRGISGTGSTVVVGGMGENASQAASTTMQHFLNQLPTVTIREGHRLKVYLTGDLDLPAYGAAR